MIVLTHQNRVWPEELRPKLITNDEKESFTDWWLRNEDKLPNLNREICEQWLYRHWDETEYAFLPLEKLFWKLESWTTNKFISAVGIWDEAVICENGHKYCQAEYDYEIFNEYDRPKYEPTLTMNKTGSWNLPVLVLYSPSGFHTTRGVREDIKYWLIEGHKRIRYLNALNYYGKGESNHSVYVLSLNSI